MGASNSVLIDFGQTPVSEGLVNVIGQLGILDTSQAESWVMATSTSDNDVTSHRFAGVSFTLTCGVPTAGVGFPIYVVTLAGQVTGKFLIQYVWN